MKTKDQEKIEGLLKGKETWAMVNARYCKVYGLVPDDWFTLSFDDRVLLALLALKNGGEDVRVLITPGKARELQDFLTKHSSDIRGRLY